MSARILAVIPARGGSKGLPGKNLRPLAGISLIAHALAFAACCPELTRTIVSTDDDRIAAAARELGGDVPFLRPAELARDDTPTWPVLRHALAACEREGTAGFDYLALVQPTAPFRLPEDLTEAMRLLAADPEADGVVSVSEPPYNPASTAVVDRGGRLEFLVRGASEQARRQDAPRVLVINGLLYLFRASLVRDAPDWKGARLVPLELPWERAVDVDEERDIALAEAALAVGLVRLPWLPQESQANTSSSAASSDRGL